jgi:hypothetical protein
VKGLHEGQTIDMNTNITFAWLDVAMYYLKNEQECFIRFKATSAQRE